MCLFLRARAVIQFALRAAGTSKTTKGEQQALRKFSASRNLFFIKSKHCVAPSNLIRISSFVFDDPGKLVAH